MPKVDGYIKRVKSLSILLVGVTVLAYDVADSGKRLTADYRRVEDLSLGAALAVVQVPTDAQIHLVDGLSMSDWLGQRGGDWPQIGALVDVLRLWEVPDHPIQGIFRQPHGEVTSFTRMPASERLGGADVTVSLPSPSHVGCVSGEASVCHRFSLTLADAGDEREAVLVYDTERHSATARGKGSWLYVDKEKRQLWTVDQVRSEILNVASRWVTTSKDAEAARSALHDKLTQRTVRIPVINLDVQASRAALFLSLAAAALAAMLAHSLLAINGPQLCSSDEPWILQVPGGPGPGFVGRFRTALSCAGGGVIALLLWCPVFVVSLSIAMTRSPLLILMQCALAAGAALAAVAATAHLLSIMKVVVWTQREEPPA